MEHLLNRNGNYYYNRRVPNTLREYDPRGFIRISLHTDSRKIAHRLAQAKNQEIEAYWASLLKTGEKHTESTYKALVDRAQLFGFVYYDNILLADKPLTELIERYNYLEKHDCNEKHVEAVLGRASAPVIKLDDAINKFWDLSKDKTIDKSENQVRKWKNPRKRAVQNFIRCVGNKTLAELTRDDVIRFKNWWIDRLDGDDLVSNTANKELVNVKTIVTTVAEHYKIDLDCERLFKKLQIKRDDAKKRPPFTTKFLLETLLVSENLKGLNNPAKYALYAFAETGAGFSELTGLRPEDIKLDVEIPHIVIAPGKKKELKTRYRKRVIPLIGFALEAFKACPNGFPDYYDRADSLSATVNKYLSENKLLPSEAHTAYSLRHSFQDRLLAVNAPDRVQADLMGHKFGRPDYGVGASLKQKLEWMERIALKPSTIWNTKPFPS